MYKALDIAYWFLAKNDEKQRDVQKNEYEGISNLKIQKLLYFAQGVSFSFYGKKLFDEKIMAWDHGPVVNEVYQEFKSHKGGSIKYKDHPSFSAQKLSEIETDQGTRSLLVDVFDCLNKYTAIQLRDFSHDINGPWAKIYNEKPYAEIPLDVFLKKYFKKLFDITK